ncbi:hypothetical protein FOC60_10035 [Rothia dentocariosa]|uniref:hypothetical protein n=2 Tax=Rothia dentocariosa TaxID=2047 RepID=UPI0008DC2A86|nr:hypothetical protein [Rothia dentocariosa]QKI10146.1 hypothetical protein FOC60_10035 [Rothia dentocariosa]
MRDSFEFMSEQSSRKNSAEQNPQDAVKPWAESYPSGFQASTVPGQYAHPGASYPELPFRWLYGVRIAFMLVSLGTSVWGLYNYVEFMAKYGFEYWDAEDFLRISLMCAFMAYYGLQILAGIFYLRSKALGFILSINIIGLILQALEIPTLIDVITHMDDFFRYADGLTYLGWALYFIDVAFCIVFIVMASQEYSRRRKNKTVWTQGVQAQTAQSQYAQPQNPPEQSLM